MGEGWKGRDEIDMLARARTRVKPFSLPSPISFYLCCILYYHLLIPAFSPHTIIALLLVAEVRVQIEI